MSQAIWIRSAFFPESPDLLFEKNEILVIQLFPPIYSIIMIIAFVVVLSFALGKFNLIVIIVSFALAWLTSAVVASRRRNRILNLPSSELSRLGNVKTIEWTKVSKIEIKERKITIKTSCGNHNSWIRNSDIAKVSLLIKWHANVNLRIFRYRLNALVIAVSLLVISFLLALVPLLAIIITGFVSLAASLALFIFFFASAKEITR